MFCFQPLPHSCGKTEGWPSFPPTINPLAPPGEGESRRRGCQPKIGAEKSGTSAWSSSTESRRGSKDRGGESKETRRRGWKASNQFQRRQSRAMGAAAPRRSHTREAKPEAKPRRPLAQHCETERASSLRSPSQEPT